jgi:hypothetical protein
MPSVGAVIAASLAVVVEKIGLERRSIASTAVLTAVTILGESVSAGTLQPFTAVSVLNGSPPLED